MIKGHHSGLRVLLERSRILLTSGIEDISSREGDLATIDMRILISRRNQRYPCYVGSLPRPRKTYTSVFRSCNMIMGGHQCIRGHIYIYKARQIEQWLFFCIAKQEFESEHHASWNNSSRFLLTHRDHSLYLLAWLQTLATMGQTRRVDALNLNLSYTTGF
jgi:hypothetical protein